MTLSPATNQQHSLADRYHARDDHHADDYLDHDRAEYQPVKQSFHSAPSLRATEPTGTRTNPVGSPSRDVGDAAQTSSVAFVECVSCVQHYCRPPSRGRTKEPEQKCCVSAAGVGPDAFHMKREGA